MNHSTISGNTAGSIGGGIYNVGTLDIDNSTISDNAASFGGGIWNESGTLKVSDSTIKDKLSFASLVGLTRIVGSGRSAWA